MRARRLAACCCGAMWLAVGPGRTVPGAAQEQAPAPVDSLAAELLEEFGWSDPDETAALIEALADGGLELSPEDLERLGMVAQGSEPATATAGAVDRAAASAGPPVRPRPLLRVETRLHAGAAARDVTARIDLAAAGLSARLRARAAAGAAPLPAGGLLAERGRWRAAAGGVGMRHGLGLLAAGPGSWATLSSAVALSPGGAGWLVHAGAREGRALWGGALTGSQGPWRLDLVAGRAQSSVSGRSVDLQRLVRLEHGGGGGAVSVLGADWAGGAGGSVAARLEAGRGLIFAGEMALWSPSGGGARRPAMGLTLAYRRGGLRLEGASALAAGGQGAPLALRPAFLPTWDAHGWAARGVWRARSHVVLQALLAQGHGREQAGDGPRTRARRTLELAAEFRPRAGVRLGARWKVALQDDAGWTDRSPWLPPALVAQSRVEQATISAARQWPGIWLQAQLRWRTAWPGPGDTGGAAGPTPAGRRALGGLLVDWRPRTGWLLRGRWGAAWGDPVNVQSVAAPAPGLVVPRHWGRWAEELGVGLEQRRGRGWWQAAAAARRPAGSAASVAGALEYWVRGGWSW